MHTRVSLHPLGKEHKELHPLGKEHRKKRRQGQSDSLSLVNSKLLQASPFAQSTSFPSLPGVTPTKSGGRGDKLDVPNLFPPPNQAEP